MDIRPEAQHEEVKQFDGLSKFCTTNVTDGQGQLTAEDLQRAYDLIMLDGASPDIVYLNEDGVDRLWRLGRITRRDYVRLKLKFRVGALKRSVTSGGRSVLRTIGMGRME